MNSSDASTRTHATIQCCNAISRRCGTVVRRHMHFVIKMAVVFGLDPESLCTSWQVHNALIALLHLKLGTTMDLLKLVSLGQVQSQWPPCMFPVPQCLVCARASGGVGGALIRLWTKTRLRILIGTVYRCLTLYSYSSLYVRKKPCRALRGYPSPSNTTSKGYQ